MTPTTFPAGEPIAGGQARRADDASLLRFEDAIDIPRILQALQDRRARAGDTQGTVYTLNLVAIFFSAAAYALARASLEAAATIHPCRLIVLISEAGAPENRAEAAISLVRAAGSVTLERVVLHARGRTVRHLESALLALLLPELPRAIVWSGKLEGELLERALQIGDRVVVDSATREPGSLVDLARLTAQGAPLGDLAWARISPWQGLAAEVLDIPDLREHRGQLRSASVVCAEHVGPEGLLLAGWFAARIPRAQVRISAAAAGCATPGDRAAGASAPEETPRAPQSPAGPDGKPLPVAAPLERGQVCSFEFTSARAQFVLRREGSLLLAEVAGDDDGALVHRIRLPLESPGRLLAQELRLLSGQDELQVAAIAAAVRLLPARDGAAGR